MNLLTNITMERKGGKVADGVTVRVRSDRMKTDIGRVTMRVRSEKMKKGIDIDIITTDATETTVATETTAAGKKGSKTRNKKKGPTKGEKNMKKGEDQVIAIKVNIIEVLKIQTILLQIKRAQLSEERHLLMRSRNQYT